MKYKRKETNISKYITASSPETKRRIKQKNLRHRTVAVFIISVTVFSLTRFGIIDPDMLKDIITSNNSKDKSLSSSHSGKLNNFMQNFSMLAHEFCFGYLRNEKDEDSKVVYADYAKKEDEGLSDGEKSNNKSSKLKDNALSVSQKVPEKPVFKPVLPCVGRISSEFGARQHPLSGEVKFHNGADIACQEGDEVRAVFDAVVEKAEYNDYSGNYVVLRHIDGFTSSYAHLSEIFVSVGQEVQGSSLIGTAGSTGQVTGPHLHFEIRQNGEPLDPFSLISGD